MENFTKPIIYIFFENIDFRTQKRAIGYAKKLKKDIFYITNGEVCNTIQIMKKIIILEKILNTPPIINNNVWIMCTSRFNA